MPAPDHGSGAVPRGQRATDGAPSSTEFEERSTSGLSSGGLMIRPRNLAILAGAAAATVAVVRHGRRATRGHTVAGGILIGHAGVYDTLSRFRLGPLLAGIGAGGGGG